jgi:valyl-tRNA synthetase
MNDTQQKPKTTLSTVYQPQDVEEKWYKSWEENGCFSCDINPDGEPFCIVMPPPNVTGQLHMGHALGNTIQDILTRWRRMQGRRAFWLPGTDHAGIATQARVEEKIAAEGLTKYDLGREAFVDRVWQWKDEYHKRISRQIRALGSSCDWDHERFTMDEGCSAAVKEVFVYLYEKGLIYRGSYIINWCPQCNTTISDIEVEHKDTQGKLWHIRYPYADGSGYIVVATTRPETMLGDTAVAVHPKDERYSDKIGKTVILPLMEREIPVIADDYCDPEFGTGAVKITPAHDPNDFDIGRRHDLEQIHVIGQDGLMTAAAGKYAGLSTAAARDQVVNELTALGLIENITEIEHAVGTCYRCGSVIEPLISPQWFVKMQPLAEPAINAVKDGSVKFFPERFAKIYTGWMENIRDWCISRQLWWGHRIPVWYCDDCGEVICASETPAACPACGTHKLHQDEDVLDTWFSSALWPFSTLGWPAETDLLKDFYPTNVLETAYDIIFFWVARMIFSGLEHMGQKPFDHVLIHGLVRDEEGHKMSKSLNNGVDPIEAIEKYGADTLRFMLITGNTPGNDMRFKWERLEASRNFLNKLWNASRFVLMNLNDYADDGFGPKYTLADQWILSRLRKTCIEANTNLEKYELGEAARGIYDFTWDEFCDWYLELAKQRLYRGTEAERRTAEMVLAQVLANILRLLSPFIPFATEEIWQQLSHEDGFLMLTKYPDGEGLPNCPEAEEKMALIMEIIRSIRNIRAEMNVPPGKKADLELHGNQDLLAFIERGKDYIAALAQAENVAFMPGGGEAPPQSAAAHVRGVDIYVPLKDLIDLDKEIARLEKEITNCEQEIARLEGKLKNPAFIDKAPAEVVEKERVKEQEYQAKKAALVDRVSQFGIRNSEFGIESPLSLRGN